MSLLSVQNLTIKYDKKEVVRNCSFKLEKKEIIVILGASGEGKTTLLKGIAGLLPHSQGDVQLKNELVLDASEKLVPGHELIKLVNQDFDLNDFHTVEENIRLRLLAFDVDYQRKRIELLLDITNLTQYRDVSTKQLSGGQKQRLAMARALADEPELLLLDEPFNQLDFQTKNVIESHIKSYVKERGLGVIMVTHNGVEAMEWADKIIFIDEGEIKRIDSPSNFYNNPQSLKEARFFGPVNEILVNGEKIYFRPSFFSLNQDDNYSIKVAVKFVKQVNLGWYSTAVFSCHSGHIQLYSTEDISEVREIFIRKISFK
ncbi:ABC transporter ATP-binding protein [Crocinitomix algicola]|uniref:ABC transporter ATP-binding protein n=1 Tax=Crocinitomix algicola TaxID=1740263 RepID=UPI000829E629|nr:ABC transporter ATP-binding protein [Crocinitomix algicola]